MNKLGARACVRVPVHTGRVIACKYMDNGALTVPYTQTQVSALFFSALKRESKLVK